MATHVSEIMNREVFSLHPMDSVETAVGGLAAMGITGAPLVDSMGVVTGMVSLRTLVASPEAKTVVDCATLPAISVSPETSIDEAARLIGSKGVHRVPVVDPEGRPVGIVSSLDLVRALMGLPVAHPATFPRLHDELGIEMTDPAAFQENEIENAPEGSGIIVLIHGRYGAPELPLYVEYANDVRARLTDLMTVPQDDYALQRILTHDRSHLRFRVAPATDRASAQKTVAALSSRMASGLPRVAPASLR